MPSYISRHQLTLDDFQGYGVFEHDVQGVGQLPVLNLPSLQAGTEEINGLAHVPSAGRAGAKAALEAMVFTASPGPELGGQSGTATLVLGSSGGPWVSDFVGKGMVVMIDLQTIPTGTVAVLATDQPATVALFAGRPNAVGGAEWVIVEGDPAVIVQAEGVHAGTAVPKIPGLPTTTPGACAPGQVEVGGQCFSTPPCPPQTAEVFGVCFPTLGVTPPVTTPPTTTPPLVIEPPETVPPTKPTEPPPAVAKPGLGKYALPIALGVGALGLVAVLAGRKKPAKRAMTPNRRGAYPKGWK